MEELDKTTELLIWFDENPVKWTKEQLNDLGIAMREYKYGK